MTNFRTKNKVPLDFINTHPDDSVNNRIYYAKDQPARSKGKLKVNFTHVPAGKYTLGMYKVACRVNDPYSGYLNKGKPKQLNQQQVEELKKQNDGSPVSTEIIEVKPNEPFSKELEIRVLSLRYDRPATALW